MHSRVTGKRASAALSAIGRASLLWRPDADFVRRHRSALLAFAVVIIVCLAAISVLGEKSSGKKATGTFQSVGQTIGGS